MMIQLSDKNKGVHEIKSVIQSILEQNQQNLENKLNLQSAEFQGMHTLMFDLETQKYLVNEYKVKQRQLQIIAKLALQSIQLFLEEIQQNSQIKQYYQNLIADYKCKSQQQSNLINNLKIELQEHKRQINHLERIIQQLKQNEKAQLHLKEESKIQEQTEQKQKNIHVVSYKSNKNQQQNLRLKISFFEHQIKYLTKELKCKENKITKQNQDIVTLEEKIKIQKQRINQLQQNIRVLQINLKSISDENVQLKKNNEIMEQQLQKGMVYLHNEINSKSQQLQFQQVQKIRQISPKKEEEQYIPQMIKSKNILSKVQDTIKSLIWYKF